MLHRRLADAERWFDEGLAWTADHDLTFWWDSMLDSRSMLRLFQGRWAEALADAEATLSTGGDAIGMQICAAATRATILLRRGDDDASEAVATLMASPISNRDDALYATAVGLERAWLDGATGTTVDIDVPRLLRDLSGPTDLWHRAAITVWLHRIDPSLVDGIELLSLPAPIERELSGDRAGAIEAWRDLGCGFEAALLLGLSDDHEELRRAFDELARLGATSTIAALRRRAAARGVRSVPRGARVSTSADPAGLTARQAEVLELLGERLTNAEIAERLVISEKTAGHHVSAILTKLGVATRTEAGAYSRQQRGARS
jgi:DNA-binding CsgD family transcriptional regulator